jgi:hypothetical protein
MYCSSSEYEVNESKRIAPLGGVIIAEQTLSGSTRPERDSTNVTQLAARVLTIASPVAEVEACTRRENGIVRFVESDCRDNR